MGFKKILVPIDFSPYSDKAVDYAIFMAQAMCANITLLHTVVLFQEDIDEKEHLAAYERIIEQKENRRAEKINTHCSHARKRGVEINSVLLRDISASESILGVLEKKKYDLVVMGTHGRTGLKRLMLGSIAESVVNLSPVPVITVHINFRKREIKKILVPVDFSKFSRVAIRQAIVLAKDFQARLEFMHVVEQQAHPEFYSIATEPILRANPNLKDHIIRNLIKLTGIPESGATYVVREGRVHDEISGYARKKKIDLIVMPISGMSALDHIVLGSNTERVVRTASCPVLTVRKT
jgi:nucleotide-binding universal stress UspA family protein